MTDEPRRTETGGGTYVLPHYLRFARTLALVASATVSVAAGAAVVSISGCETVCAGTPCGGHQITMGVRPIPTSDAADVGPAIVDAGASDGASDTGGGPRPAPLLPRAWIG